MKRHKKSIALVISVLCAAAAVYADIAPEPGYTRVYSNLILDPQDDFQDLRFFLESGGTLEELKIHKGKQNVIRSKGGGARYNQAAVYAVPAKSLTSFGENLSGEKLAALETALSSNHV